MVTEKYLEVDDRNLTAYNLRQPHKNRRNGSVTNLQTKNLTKIALCVALCCITAGIAFPLPFTPGMVTALTITMSLTAYVLSPKETFIVLFIYILMGGIGLPVFAGGSGPGKLFGPVGGFYFAWLVAYPVLSFVKGRDINFKRYVIANILTAMPITYAGGIISMVIVMDISFWQAFSMSVFPFIPGDLIKTCAAAFLGAKLNQRLKNF